MPPLCVKLTILPKEMLQAPTEAMEAQSDIPKGMVIENKGSNHSKKEEEEEGKEPPAEPELVEEEQAASEVQFEETEMHLKEATDRTTTSASNSLNVSASSGNNFNASSGDLSKGSISIDSDRQNELDDANRFFAMRIESSGKYSRKAELEDIARFAKVDTVDSNKLKEWLKSYLEQNFPEQLEKPNCIPRSAHIKDDLKKGLDCYKTYGWKPIKLHLQPGLIDVKDQYTKQITLEQFKLDYATDLETALREKGDKEVVSFLRKGAMAGHPLAVDLFNTSSKKSKKGVEDTQVVTEFRGMDSVVFTLGNNQGAGKIDEETGDLVWKDVKKLRALLKDKPLPKKTGKGVSRNVDVLALESYMKARVYYKANFTGTVSTDHGNEQFDGRRYWNWDLKYLLRYNGVPNAVVMYQDVELKFYSQIQYAMENEDWEWQNVGGSWVKVKLATVAENKAEEDA